MIKFTREAQGLKNDESYMYSDKLDSSPLIKIKTYEITPEKWGGISDEGFIEKFVNE